MQIDKSQFHSIFKAEVEEHLKTISLGLLQLQKLPIDLVLLKNLNREAHTIHGAAKVMGYKDISEVGRCLEEGFHRAASNEFLFEAAHFATVFSCLEVIQSLLDDNTNWNGKKLTPEFLKDFCQETRAVLSAQTKV